MGGVRPGPVHELAGQRYPMIQPEHSGEISDVEIAHGKDLPVTIHSHMLFRLKISAAGHPEKQTTQGDAQGINEIRSYKRVGGHSIFGFKDGPD